MMRFQILNTNLFSGGTNTGDSVTDQHDLNKIPQGMKHFHTQPAQKSEENYISTELKSLDNDWNNIWSLQNLDYTKMNMKEDITDIG